MKQDPYASSIFTEQWEQPVAVYPELPEPEDGPEEDIDYWSVEAYRRGWHGAWGEHRAKLAIREGRCPLGTMRTPMENCW